MIASLLTKRDIFVRFFDYAIRFLIIFLPFSSLISVFLTYKIGIHGANFIKEIVLALAIISLSIVYLMSFFSDKKYRFSFGWIDFLIMAYIGIFTIITVFTTGFRGFIFGGRYDFEFLMMFLCVFHGFPLLQKPISYYLRLFLVSSGIMIFLSGLLKWPLSEDLLLYFGYSGNPSNWDFGGAPPIFHGIDGANVRRFQGILDSPNTMGAFLILYSGVLAYFLRNKKEWYFFIAIILSGLFLMVFYTYSRSAILGMSIAYCLVLLSSLRGLWILYRYQLITVFLIVFVFLGALGVLYFDKATSIVARAGSTQGHAERMIVGINRTLENPYGQGLASAGPGYRYVINTDRKDPKNTDDLDRFYIPESWYIQQFVEGGFVGGALFLVLMGLFFFSLYRIHPILGSTFLGIAVMNLFLHTFESSVLSLSLFLLMGLLLSHQNKLSMK